MAASRVLSFTQTLNLKEGLTAKQTHGNDLPCCGERRRRKEEKEEGLQNLQLSGTGWAEQHQVWGGSNRAPAAADLVERGRSSLCWGVWVWILYDWDLLLFGMAALTLLSPSPPFCPFGGCFLGQLRPCPD